MTQVWKTQQAALVSVQGAGLCPLPTRQPGRADTAAGGEGRPPAQSPPKEGLQGAQE